MASDAPVYFWLFLQFSRTGNFYDAANDKCLEQERLHTRPEWCRTTSPLDECQEEHYSDWRIVTGTCHRLRECGMSAFFSEKVFIIPPGMVQTLWDGKVRSPSFEMAANCIQKVVAPIDSYGNATAWMALPKYHQFKRLTTLTIDTPYSAQRIIDGHKWLRPWPREPPTKLLNLLARLGLRVNEIQLRLIVRAKEESEVPSTTQGLERRVFYPLIRSLNRRRAKPGDPPLSF